MILVSTEKKNGSRGLLAALAILSASSAAQAVPVTVKYIFNDASTVSLYANPGLDPASTIPLELSGFSSWTDTDGTLIETLPFDSTDGLVGSGTPSSRAVAARSWNDGNAFSFSFSIGPNSKLAISKIDFLQQGSNGAQGLGPTSWTLQINGNQVGDGSATRGNPLAAKSVDTVTPSLNNPLLTFGQNLSGPIAFRIFATGADVTGATWRIDDFTITGELTTVPVPAAVWLMGSALSGLLVRRRKTALN